MGNRSLARSQRSGSRMLEKSFTPNLEKAERATFVEFSVATEYPNIRFRDFSIL